MLICWVLWVFLVNPENPGWAWGLLLHRCPWSQWGSIQFFITYKLWVDVWVFILLVWAAWVPKVSQTGDDNASTQMQGIYSDNSEFSLCGQLCWLPVQQPSPLLGTSRITNLLRYCHAAGPYGGPSQSRSFPDILCFSSSSKYHMCLGGLQEHHDLTSVGSYKNKGFLRPRILQQPTTPLPHLAFKNALQF